MKICVLDAATLGADLDITPFEECGEVIVYPLTAPQEVEERIRDVDVIITNKIVLDRNNLKEAKNLKLIALLSTGYNTIDIEYAKSKGIGVANVAGYSTESVAQHTFAMILHLVHHNGQYDEYVKSKQYVSSEMFTFIAWPFNELNGKTIGIIGMGAIGNAVARIAEAFGMKVIYYSTTGKNTSHPKYQNVDLKQLLNQSDIVSIHSPYSENTHHLITYKEMKMMKNTAYILNLGRGNIVVEEDLANAINDNIIAGAGVDVLSKEPIDKNSPLFKVKDQNKLFITPHIAWSSVEARNLLVREVTDNIHAIIDGKKRNRIV